MARKGLFVRIEEQAQNNLASSLKEEKGRNRKLHSVENKSSFVEQNKSNFLFELGSLKFQIQKENVVTYKNEDKKHKELENSHEEKEEIKQLIQERQRRADMSYAQRRVNSLFKPASTSRLVNIVV